MFVLQLLVQLELSVASRFMNVFELSAFQLHFSMLKHHKSAAVIGKGRQNRPIAIVSKSPIIGRNNRPIPIIGKSADYRPIPIITD